MSAKRAVLLLSCCFATLVPAVGRLAAAPIAGVVSAIDPTQNSINLLYDPATGGVRVVLSGDANATRLLTSLQINSSAGDFTGVRPTHLTGAFDVFRADRLFKMDVAGFGPTIDFGAALAAGKTSSELAASLTVSGSYLGGGSLDQTPARLVMPIPEPAAATLAAIAVATGAWGWGQRGRGGRRRVS